MSTEKDSIARLVEQQPGPMKFFVSYAGWGPGQLEKEMEEGSWLTTPATSEEIFQTDEDQWDRLRNRNLPRGAVCIHEREDHPEGPVDELAFPSPFFSFFTFHFALIWVP